MADIRQTIRIFISSPGDVSDERDGARRVIDWLGRLYPNAKLQAVLWEELALPATASFQQTIDYLLEKEPIDIAVFILWSRLGSPLGAAVTRADGTPYRSGTEREFDLMLTAFEQSGRTKPVILAYVRDDDRGFKRRLAESEKSELPELIDQQQLAEAFIVERFHDAEGRNVRAYQTYSEPIGFQQRLRVHLRRAVDDLLNVESAATWTDEPYRGLQTFDIEHAPIFHGRDDETCNVLQRLRDQEQAGCAFVVIVAASGSGKSSLARAGVAANLIQQGGDDGDAPWKVASLIPAVADQSPCHGLVRSLAEVLPDLIDSEVGLAGGLAENAPLTVKLTIAPAFARASVRMLLILDQMEELWTDRQTTGEKRESFLTAVEALARSGCVSVLATLRSDFYHHAQASPTFLSLKGDRGQFDLLPPDAGSILRLITEPARMSDTRFEQNERTGRSLYEVILKDASREPNALPLLEYTLSELYRGRDASRRLMTFTAYVELGGVEGAIGRRADETLGCLPADAQAALNEVLPLLVSVDVAGELAVRRRPSLADLTSTPARRTLTENLIEKRFLTTDGEGETPVASLAHEALLRSWDRIVDWINSNREQLRLRARVEQQQQRWEQQNRDNSLLLSEGLPLDEGRQLIEEASYLLSESTADFVRTSMTQHKQRTTQIRRTKQFVGTVFVTLLAVITLGAFISRRQRQREVTESLVTAVSTARGIAFPPTVNDLDDLPKKMVLKELVTRFESVNGATRLPLAFALARFGDVRPDFLVSQIGDAKPEEFDNFIAAFQESRQESLEAIRAVADATDDSEPQIRLKARLAMLSLYLGNPSLANQMSQLRSEPIQRTVLINEGSSWCGDLIQLKQLASEVEEAPLRCALCLVAGSVSPDRVTVEQRIAWQPVLTDWHCRHPDGGIHSASGWALKKLGFALPDLSGLEPDDQRQWRVKNTGITMIRIPAGKIVNEEGKTVEASQDFLMSDQEVSVKLFQQFIDDPDYPKSEKPASWAGVDEFVSPTPNHPVQQVSWYDAVMFCNWLSRREGLQPCYRREGKRKTFFSGEETEQDDWRLDSSSIGFRLPTDAEWEYACRAGTTTVFSCGNEVTWLDGYGTFEAFHAEACSYKLPNLRGLFDMHGNVGEWVNDANSRTVMYRGGSWDGSAILCSSSYKSWTAMDARSKFLGFRVAAVPFASSEDVVMLGDTGTAALSYEDFSDASTLNLSADAAAPLGANNVLRLTDRRGGEAWGSAWHSESQMVAAHFETEFEFQVSGDGATRLWFVIQNESLRPISNWTKNSLFVELDADANELAVYGNSDGASSRLAAEEFGRTQLRLDIDDGQTHHVRVSYSPGMMSVFLDDVAEPTLAVAIDLASLLKLDDGRGWLGFTSNSTAADYDLLRWEFTPLGGTCLSIRDGAVLEGNKETSDLLFSVTRLGDVGSASSVEWKTEDLTAVGKEDDYVPDSGRLVFAAGEMEKEIRIRVNGDSVEEGFERFSISLFNESEGSSVGNRIAYGTIENDDARLSVADARAQEGGGAITFLGEFASGAEAKMPKHSCAVRFGPNGDLFVAAGEAGVIRFAGRSGALKGVFANCSALSQSVDLAFGPDGHLYVADNVASQIVRFNGVTGEFIDVFVEPHEGGLDSARGLTFGPGGDLYVASGATHEILRFDGSDGSFDKPLVTANSGGMVSPRAITFHGDFLYVSDGNFRSGIFRYHGKSGTFVDQFVLPGTAGLSRVTTGGLGFGPDVNADGVQDLWASSSNSCELLVFDGTTGDHLKTLVEPTLMTEGLGGFDFDTYGNVYVFGGNEELGLIKFGDNSQARFEVTLSSPSAMPISVDYATIEGSAMEKTDFAPSSGTIQFAPGVTSRTIIVPTIDDQTAEDTEVFELLLSGASGAIIADATAIGTIHDDGDVGLISSSGGGD